MRPPASASNQGDGASNGLLVDVTLHHSLETVEALF